MDELDRLLAKAKERRAQVADPEMGQLIRKRAGLTLEEVAALVGVTSSAVSRWEAGRRTPRDEALVRYRELLGRLSSKRS